MKVLNTIETRQIKKGINTFTIEHKKVLKKNQNHSSSDPRAGKWTSDDVVDIVFVNGVNWMRCNCMETAITEFNEGAFKMFLPRL